MNTESQQLNLQLNEFYRDKYRFALKCMTVLVVVCVILSSMLVWMTYSPSQPAYYAASTTGEVLPLHPLSEPILTNDFISEWSALTTRLIYNMDFSKYQNQLAAIQDRFTSSGWEKLNAALNGSGLISELVNNRLIISSVVSGQPVILASMVLNGRFTWRVQMRLLVTYTSASEQTQRTWIVTMNVQRVPTLDAKQGIQVMDFNMAPVV